MKNGFLGKIISYYKNGTEGIKIIYACVVSTFLYLVLNFISIKIFSFPLSAIFLLSAGHVFPYLWTVFTFSFIHLNLFELLISMIMIYFVEKIFRIYFNGESFIKFFFLGNLVGALLFLLICSITGNKSLYLNGAILGVYSVLFAIISYMPKMKVSLFPLPFQMPLYALGLIIIGLDMFSLLDTKVNIAYFISRFSAAIFGYLYMKVFQNGNDFLGKIIPNIPKLLSTLKNKTKLSFKIKRGGIEDTAFYHPKTDEEFNKEKVGRQKKVDEILDKISAKGYDSLTREEKDFLFGQSK